MNPYESIESLCLSLSVCVLARSQCAPALLAKARGSARLGHLALHGLVTPAFHKGLSFAHGAASVQCQLCDATVLHSRSRSKPTLVRKLAQFTQV